MNSKNKSKKQIQKINLQHKIEIEQKWNVEHTNDVLEKFANSLHLYSIEKNKKLLNIKTHILKANNKVDNLLKTKKINLREANTRKKCINDKYKKILNKREMQINLMRKKKKTIQKKKILKVNTITKKSINQLNQYNSHNDSIIFHLFSITRRKGYVNLYKKILNGLNQNKLMIIVFAIAIFAGIFQPIFFSKINILDNILEGNVVVGIMAIGMTFIILTGGIDLSVGSLLGLMGILTFGFIIEGMNIVLAFFIGLLISLIIGTFHGILVSKLNLPPFIVTLVGLLSYRGVTKILANSKTFTIFNNSTFNFFNTQKFLNIPILVWIFAILVILSMIILKFTKLGRNIYAVGGNVEAAKLSGINKNQIIIFAYLFSSITVLIATFAFAVRVTSFGPETGSAYELNVISAVVLGGTSLSGGKGGVGRTFLGWLVISTLGNALLLIGYSTDWQLVFKGIIILIAIILDKNLNILAKMKKIYRKYL